MSLMFNNMWNLYNIHKYEEKEEEDEEVEDEDEELKKKKMKSIVQRRRISLLNDYLDELEEHVRKLITTLGYNYNIIMNKPSQQEFARQPSKVPSVISTSLSSHTLLRNFSKSEVRTNSMQILFDIAGHQGEESCIKKFRQMIDKGKAFVLNEKYPNDELNKCSTCDSTKQDEDVESCTSVQAMRFLQDELKVMSVYEESLKQSVSSIHCLEIELRKLLEENRPWQDDWVPGIFSEVSKEMDGRISETSKLLDYLIQIISTNSLKAMDINRRLSKTSLTETMSQENVVSAQEIMYVMAYRCCKLKELLKATKLHTKPKL